MGGYGKIGGEGMAFVLHADPRGPDATGCPGTGLGFASNEALNCSDHIVNSLALEFDSFFNVTEVEEPITRGLSPAQHHTLISYSHRDTLSLFTHGENDHSDPIASVSLRQHHHIPLDDGLLHVVRVNYVVEDAGTSSTAPPGQLSVWVDDRLVLS